MKINFNQNLKKIDGTPMMEQKVEGGQIIDTQKPITLKDVCTSVLMQNDDKIDGKEKYERFKLAMLIQEGKGDVELNIEGAAKIIELIGKVHAPLIYGQCYEILNQI